MTAPHLLIGIRGETIAADFLRSIGYGIRERNIVLDRDEIDILAFDPIDGTLVFAEVKSRSVLEEEYPPEMAADWRKLRKLRRSARKWVAFHDYEGPYRLDLVCVAAGRVTAHYKELGWG